jgi:hypothetical protein
MHEEASNVRLKKMYNLAMRPKGRPSAKTDWLSDRQSQIQRHFQLLEEVILRPTVSRPVFHSIGNSFGTHDQTLITVAHLRVSSCGAPSLTRGRVCNLSVQLLLGPASAFILGF